MGKVGLILEGGGQRGIYTAGILDYLMDAGIRIGYVIGVSAGAACATAYLSGQKGRNYNVFISSAGKRKYLSLLNYFTQGSVFGLKYVFDELPNKTIPLDYESADRAGMEFWVVSTDCRTGRPHYKKVDNLKNCMRYLMASSAIPLVSRMYRLDGELLLDGGASDSIPIKKSISDGNDKNIVVLTKNAGYRLKEPSWTSRFLANLLYHKHPAFRDVLLERHRDYNASLDLTLRLEREGKALVLRPSKPLAVGKFEKNRETLIGLYQNGYEDAKEIAPRIMNFLKDASNAQIPGTKNMVK